MTWTAYKVVLRLQTPMHIGQAKSGNLQLTRPYVHGKALWGALTARITRDTPRFNNDYKTVGDQVKEELAFSYFYPTTSQDVTLWPWKDPERFAWQFLGSYASTALNYSQNSAEEGTLHETEFIAPRTREDEPVNLVGYIFEQEGCTLPWRPALDRLQLGGERTYGWGRVTLQGQPQSASDLFGLDLPSSGNRPVIKLTQGETLLAHALAHGDRAVPAKGRVVPLVGRETSSANKHGQKVIMAAVCWEPGSRIQAPSQVLIGDYGVWKKAPAGK